MSGHVSAWGRLRALLQGEVASDALDAYRRAGAGVYELLGQVEDQRLALKIQGVTPWQTDLPTRAFFLCAWNAFALQSLGDAFLDPDDRSDPATVGYVPPVTARQVHAFYGQVEEWLNRARQAQDNASYRLDVAVPAELPGWVEAHPCPATHVEAMLGAARALRTHAEGALALFEAEGAPLDKPAAVQQLHQLRASATTQAEYAEGLWGPAVPQEIHEQVERQVKGAVAAYYRLGQLLAMPPLLDAGERPDLPATTPAGQPRGSLSRPGEPGFDPWCLTDPATREEWKRDSRARETIDTIWRDDPDPRRTLEIQDEIDAALDRGDVAFATDRSGRRLGHYYMCPWSAIYVAMRPVSIGGRDLASQQQFTYDVSVEGPDSGGFKRQILVANFQPTDRVHYHVSHDDDDCN